MISRVNKTELIEWKSAEWLQGELKKISKEALSKLKTSLLNNGFIMPFNVWLNQGDNKVYILDGHHRKMALQSLEDDGIIIPDKLPANFIDCKNRKEASKLVLVYSSLYARASSESLLDFINLENIDINDLQLEIDIPDINLDNIFQTDLTDEQLDDVPEVQETAISQLGDIFLIDGRHHIMCGDSTNAEMVNLLMDGNKADMVFTDPPYGVSIGKKNKMLNSFQPSGRNLRDIEDDSKTPDELYIILTKAFKNLRSVLSDCCTVFVTAPQRGSLGMMMMMMMKDSGLEIKHVLMWYKNAPTFSMGRLDYDYQHEPILLTWTKSHKFYGGGKHKSSVWKIDKPRKCDLHPTMKPVELIENALLNNSVANNIITDIYLGSGSTLIAAAQTNRVCYGMELDPHYIDVILNRYHKLYPDKEIVCLNRDINMSELLHES